MAFSEKMYRNILAPWFLKDKLERLIQALRTLYDNITDDVAGINQPEGMDKEVQFNDDDVLGAEPEFTYDKVTKTLTVDGLDLSNDGVLNNRNILTVTTEGGAETGGAYVQLAEDESSGYVALGAGLVAAVRLEVDGGFQIAVPESGTYDIYHGGNLTAALVPVEDTGGNFTATDVEGVLAEIAATLGSGVEDGDKGDVTVASGVWTIDNNVVSDAKLRDSAALSVIGRSANSSGDPADIAAGTDGHVLRRSGTTLGFGTIATGGIADGAVTLAKTSGVAQDRRTVTAVTSSSGTATFNVALGDYFTIALSENVTTVAFSNLPGSGLGATLMIRITQDSTPRTVTWPASFRWGDGEDTDVSTGSGAVDVLALTTFDNGTTWDATLSKDRS